MELTKEMKEAMLLPLADSPRYIQEIQKQYKLVHGKDLSVAEIYHAIDQFKKVPTV